jgi:hypothetical protein
MTATLIMYEDKNGNHWVNCGKNYEQALAAAQTVNNDKRLQDKPKKLDLFTITIDGINSAVIEPARFPYRLKWLREDKFRKDPGKWFPVRKQTYETHGLNTNAFYDMAMDLYKTGKTEMYVLCSYPELPYNRPILPIGDE